MPFVSIPVVRTDNNTPAGNAYISPAQVVSVAQPRDNPHGWTHIHLNDGHDSENRRVLVTAQQLSTTLAALGPFIEIQRLPIETADNWPVWYVRPSAIVALRPTGEGRGRLWLTGGHDLAVSYADAVEFLTAAGGGA